MVNCVTWYYTLHCLKECLSFRIMYLQIHFASKLSRCSAGIGDVRLNKSGHELMIIKAGRLSMKIHYPIFFSIHLKCFIIKSLTSILRFFFLKNHSNTFSSYVYEVLKK